MRVRRRIENVSLFVDFGRLGELGLDPDLIGCDRPRHHAALELEQVADGERGNGSAQHAQIRMDRQIGGKNRCDVVGAIASRSSTAPSGFVTRRTSSFASWFASRNATPT